MSPDAHKAWLEFFTADVGHCHAIGLQRMAPEDLANRVTESMKASEHAVARMLRWMGNPTPARILDVGSSAGMNAMALAERFPRSQVCGLEPEGPALRVARAMKEQLKLDNFQVAKGVGEALPFRSGSFDLVICVTVIEHVQDVDTTIKEMARVLSPGGRLYLEAPNYV